MEVFITLEEVCTAAGGKVIQAAATEFTGISTDTRNIKPGDLFVAMTGENFDGHDFVHQAVAGGAAGIIISRPAAALNTGTTVIAVTDTLQAYQAIAARHRSKFSIPVIAITGSNGKTTTKEFTAAVLSSRFSVLKTKANYNNEIGLPLTLLGLNKQHEAAVVELGMRGLGEIRQLADIARPTMAIITNVSETHMELLGSLEHIAAAKAELVEAIPASGMVILNADNAYVRTMAAKTSARTVFYGIDHPCQVQAVNIVVKDGVSQFDCVYPQGVFSVKMPVAGRHNIYNALAAFAAGLELGLCVNEIQAGLQRFSPGAMRLTMETMPGYMVINDAYNASPVSMAAAIDTLKEVAGGRTVAVLGDMLELGDIAVQAHSEIGHKLARSKVDIVVTVGELASNIARTARQEGMTEAVSCDNHRQAAEYLRSAIKPGDTLLLKGSRGMKMEQILEELR